MPWTFTGIAWAADAESISPESVKVYTPFVVRTSMATSHPRGKEWVVGQM